MKILIADDTAVVRDRVKKLLAQFNGIDAIYEAENVMLTIQMINDYNPDIILLDFLMPDGNALEVLQAIGERNNTVIIMLSNYSYPEYRHECISSGADYFFDKSNEFTRIREIFSALLEKS